ncbi:MAG: protein kinase [Myxococcota bacterium]|jgi:serine/threonine-protein kinase|nr:protein kinase [Myxococcota bacterium]
MGERFGNYELLEKIAVGGMAEIFLARASHGRGVTRQIVIKRIHPALSSDDNFVGMFIDEARLGVTMMHGNIVPVFDFGCIDGYYYLAMEYVSGRDLSALMGRARVVGVPWPTDIALYVVMEVLEGLEYAHRKRDDQGRPIELVHRDVSPSNILVSRDGQVKLLDFGIARSLASEYETRTGIIKGKPGYMSPEQANGAAVDARADIWSCGAVLHELLTGVKIKEARLSAHDERLDAVLEQALAADPASRFSTAREFQEALAAILVERSQRPTARDLTAVVEKITRASATSEDWNLQTSRSALEKHLAQALATKAEKERSSASSRISTLSASSPPPRDAPVATEHTLRLARRPAHLRIWLAAISASFAVSSIAWLALAPKIATAPTPALGGTAAAAAMKGALANAFRMGRPPPAAMAYWRGPDASLVVLGSPSGAVIEIDGVPKGRGKIELSHLSPGRHTITLKAPGFAPRERQFELRPGQAETIALSLTRRPDRSGAPRTEPMPGRLSINTQPWSHVTIDGKNAGNTPIMDLAVPSGPHTLVLTNPVRNLSRTVVVEVKPGESKRIREVLDNTAP